jgi:hypothetical protein
MQKSRDIFVGGGSALRSRFLKVENRHEDLIWGINSKTNLQNTFFKIWSRFFGENEILSLQYIRRKILLKRFI